VNPHRSLRALLVDVPSTHARLLDRALAEAGWRMRAESADGSEALSAALRHRDWDVVLYAGDGPGAVPARKALALVRLADPHLPFVAVSPWVHAGDLAAVIRGLDADVPVVPDPGELPAALTRALDAARLRRRVGGAHKLLLAQQAITDAIAAGLPPDELSARVLATLGASLGWSAGAVWRPGAGGALECTGTWHAGANREAAALAEACSAATFAPGQGLPGRVYAFRRPSWVRDVTRDGAEPRAAQARRAGLMTAVAFPIAHGDRCAGVIEFFARGLSRPNAEVSAMFATVGGQLAQYLERRRHEQDESGAQPAADVARRLLDATGSLVAVLDRAGHIRLAGARTCAALGRPESELIGAPWLDVAVPPADREHVEAVLGAAATGVAPARVEHALAGQDGGRVVRWRAARVDGGGDPLVLLTGEPAPARTGADPVTGLADRAGLEAAAGEAVERAREAGTGVALVQVDVDDFRVVNDSLGHAGGDALLRELASRMRAALPDSALLARTGGDELVAMLPDLNGDPVAVAERHAEAALSALTEPVEVGGETFRVSASAGIAAFPRDAQDAAELISAADRAKYQAKQLHRGAWSVYRPGDTARLDTLSLAAGLQRALGAGELLLHWQPLHGLTTGALVGLEALVRWQHPERGLVPPAEFIPIAEQTGVIEALGDWVLAKVCEQQVTWAARGLHPHLSFNVSPTQLRRPDFVARVAAQLAVSGADPARLTAELTESSTLEDPTMAEPLVRDLHALGMRIALDDFGSGYSSLSRLSELPVTTLKIDRAFMRDVPDRPEAAAVVTAILQLARALGRTAVAEGVETEAQRDFLAAQGCPLAQGFLFGAPMPAEEVEELMVAATRRRLGQSVSVAP
jgi:diguanylate cyclase (GGDEF)-like protein